MAKEAKHVITIEMTEWENTNKLINDEAEKAVKNVGPESTVEDILVVYFTRVCRKMIGDEIMDMTILEAEDDRNKEKLEKALAIIYSGRNDYNLMPDNLM